MSLLTHLSIRHKLLLAFGSIALLTAAVGFMAVSINYEIEIDIAQIRQAAVEKAEAVSTMAESLLELKLYTEESLNGHQATTALGTPNFSKTAQGIADTIHEFEEALALTRKSAMQAIELAKHEGNADELQKAKEEVLLLGEIDSKYSRLKKIVQTEFTGVNATSNQEGDVAHQLLWDNFDQVSVLVEKYEADTKNQLGNEVRNIEGALVRANAILFSFALLILVLGSFLTWFISRTVSRPIGILSDFAQRIGQGDLDATIKLQSQDEFGLLAETFNQMTKDLRTKTVSKDYVESIFKSMVNTLIVISPDHTILSINKATLQLLGYLEAELIGQSMDRVLQLSQSSSQSLLDEALEKGFVSNVDTIYQAKDSRLIPMAFSASVLRDLAGSVSGLVCVAEDISERKEAERKLEQANKQLLETSRQAGMAEVATSVLHRSRTLTKRGDLKRLCFANLPKTPRVSITIRRTTLAKRRMGRNELKLFSNWNDGKPETELNFKFYRQATNKIRWYFGRSREVPS